MSFVENNVARFNVPFPSNSIFADDRSCSLPPGEAWRNRHHVTDFARQLRRILLEVEKRRDQPFLLAARVPEKLASCHFASLYVQTWAQEQFVNIFVLGCQSLEKAWWRTQLHHPP